MSYIRIRNIHSLFSIFWIFSNFRTSFFIDIQIMHKYFCKSYVYVTIYKFYLCIKHNRKNEAYFPTVCLYKTRQVRSNLNTQFLRYTWPWITEFFKRSILKFSIIFLMLSIFHSYAVDFGFIFQIKDKRTVLFSIFQPLRERIHFTLRCGISNVTCTGRNYY